MRTGTVAAGVICVDCGHFAGVHGQPWLARAGCMCKCCYAGVEQSIPPCPQCGKTDNVKLGESSWMCSKCDTSFIPNSMSAR